MKVRLEYPRQQTAAGSFAVTAHSINGDTLTMRTSEQARRSALPAVEHRRCSYWAVLLTTNWTGYYIWPRYCLETLVPIALPAVAVPDPRSGVYGTRPQRLKLQVLPR